MSFHDPVAFYTPVSNIEAHFIRGLLTDAGIEAAVVEDNSQIGVWLGGLASQLHKPVIMIERVDAERALPVLEKYEQLVSQRRAAEQSTVDIHDGMVAVYCDGCGTTAQFPVSQIGTVKNCPHCSDYVDVGEGTHEIEGWDVVEEDPVSPDEEWNDESSQRS